jgi:ketosteroid isomerase-like protein
MRILHCALLVTLTASGILHAQGAVASPRTEIETFNRAFDDATRHMDNAATLALWEDDGISLLPSTNPIVGKKAIAGFMDAVMKDIAGGRMEKFENECHDIEVSGAWASEWCLEHQIVQLPGDKRFDGWGKMLLVLHRGADGKWRIKREMWNQANGPEATGR